MKAQHGWGCQGKLNTSWARSPTLLSVSHTPDLWHIHVSAVTSLL